MSTQPNNVDPNNTLNKIAKGAPIGAKVLNIWNIVTIIGLSCIMIPLGIIFLVVDKSHWYFGTGIIFIPIIFFVLQIISNRRIVQAVKGFSSSDSPSQNQVGQTVDSLLAPQSTPMVLVPPISPDPDEQVTAKIIGIMKAGFGLRGVEILGAGKINDPENTMVITTKRIAFIYVPLPGGDTLISGVDVGMWETFLASKNIQAGLDDMLSSTTLDAIVASNQNNYFIQLNDIQEVSFGRVTSTITFLTTSRGKISYSIMGRGNMEKAKSIFASYVKNQ